MNQSAFVENEKHLAARHESAHVVINAAKGRRIEEVRIGLRDGGSYHGVTYVRIFTAGGTEPGQMQGVVGDRGEHFAKMKEWADIIIATQQAEIALPLEDELITLAAGIEAEEMIAKEKGWSLDKIDEKIQAEQDRIDAKEKVHLAGRPIEFDALWQSARTAASQLLGRPDIRKAWDLITELLIISEEIKWENMSEQMIGLLTRLSGRDQLI